MVGVLAYDRSLPERKIIEADCRQKVGRLTDERLCFHGLGERDVLMETFIEEHLTHFLYYEIADRGDVDMLMRLRKKDLSPLLMILASEKVSPVNYLKPGISPDALLLQPFGLKEFKRANAELFAAFIERQSEKNNDSFFAVHTRDENCQIPYGKISYFEASNKKIIVRAGNDEFELYGSMESIAGNAPDYFVRVHRSYLVNVRKIRKARLADGYLEMDVEAYIPVSKTYRKEVRALLR